MKVSIIIPVYNEEETIASLLEFLLAHKSNPTEIVVVDGNSSDHTLKIVGKFPVKLIRTSNSSRASQMNLGARESTGDLLFFVHADVTLRPDFEKDIQILNEANYEAGCYYYKFDTRRWLPQTNAFFTRFNVLAFRGGDQTLIIKRKVFEELGGYDEKYVVMEDFDLVRKLMKRKKFKVIQKPILVSARKYEKNSWIKVQIANLIAFGMFRLHRPPQRIKDFYYSFLK